MNSTLHHVGVVVPSIEQAQELMDLFGWVQTGECYVAGYQARCLFVGGPGERSAIELIVPGGGRLAAFNKGAGGLHHIALRVSDLREATSELQGRNITLLEKQPVDAGPILINFIPPAYTRGVITELVQEK